MAFVTRFFAPLTSMRPVSGRPPLMMIVSLDSPTLADAMQLCQAHRPDPADLEKLANTAGIAAEWQRKIRTRADWLRRNTPQTQPQSGVSRET
jgi:hypothetical protein